MENYPDSDISIRPMDISDADDFMQWYSDKNVSQFCSWDTYTSKEAAIEHVANYIMNHPWHRAICLSGRPVGYVLITPFDGKDKCRAEIGYGVASEYWGRGIATRAVKIAANAIFLEWVMEKAGFTSEGLLRKYYFMKGRPRNAFIFSLLRTDLVLL